MNLTLKKKKDTPAPDLQPVVAGESWTAGSALATKGLTWLLWSAIVAGPIALILVVLTSGGSTPPPAASSADSAEAQTIAEEFAETYVVRYLTSDRDTNELTQTLTADGGDPLLADGLQISNTAVAAATQVSKAQQRSVWSVTVATDINGARRYLLVPVQVDGTAAIAVTPPAVVPAPLLATSDDIDLTNEWPPNDPAVQSISAFLNALLTGNGEVSVYTSPGVQLNPVTPPLFKEVKIRSVVTDLDRDDLTDPVADGTTIQTMTDATAVLPKDNQLAVRYALTLTSRDGRWEVAAIDPAPPLTAPEETSTSSTTMGGN